MSSPRDASSRWPDFLLIGAPKAGTTALFMALSRHPRIFASAQKEPRYFAYPGKKPQFAGPGGRRKADNLVWAERDYLGLFAACPAGHKAGEASTTYLHHPQAPANVRAKVPDARLIAVLRQPVDRAYSQWLHFRQEGLERISDFETAWRAGPDRVARGWSPVWLYRERGFYGEQLGRWLACFPREQLLVLFYEDWLHRPAEILAQICAHLGLEDFAEPIVTRENVSSRQPRWEWLHHRLVLNSHLRAWAQRRLPLWLRDAITRPINRINLRRGPGIDPALRARLSLDFRDDIERLETITGRDLSHWLARPES